jgi:large subunit ribosomal protein L22
MEKHVTAKYERVPPRKAQIILDVIRGQKVEAALNQLHFINKQATLPIEKTIRSAVASIVNEQGSTNIDTDTLYIKHASVSKGPMLKRFMSRSMGRANRVLKRMCHIKIVIANE